MGGGAGAGAGAETTKKQALGAASNGDGAVDQRQKPQPAAQLPVAGVADGSAAVHQSCGSEEEDQDDEQVERFYALLANIRALRGLYSAGTGPAAASGRGTSRKRAREAEPPWTPAFRLEDFEVEEEVNHHGAGAGAADARRAVMNKGSAGGRAARRPAAAGRTGADDGHEEDGVAEAARRGSKLGRRRVAARG